MNLQELCIEVIGEEFDRYYAFFNNDDAHLKRKFEFLQRAYSLQIVAELDQLDNLKTNYIEVLVNKYMNILHTDWFTDVPWETVIAKFAGVGCNIQEMYFFEEYNVEKPWQNIFQYVFNLEVALFFGNCNDEMLKCISQFCPNIVKIDVRNSYGVTNEGITYLCTEENGKSVCPKLKELLISHTGVNGEGVRYLIRNLPSLEVTDFHRLADIVGLSQLLSATQPKVFGKVKLFNLTSLNIPLSYPGEFYSFFAVCLLSCPRLKSLSCSVGREDHLDLFPSALEKLNLKCLREEININSFLCGKGRKLTSLSVSDCFLSLPTLADSCPCLKHLTMQNVNFNNEDIIHVFRQLGTCIFEDITYQSTVAKAIALILKSSPKLRRLAFKRCDFSSTDLRRDILRCYKYRSAVGMEFVNKFFEDCPSLECFEWKGKI